MNKLSKRLETVASFIDKKDKSVIDIGCDHGLLSIFLAEKYQNLNIIASDVNDNALESARRNVSKYKLEDRIDIRLGSGLSVIKESDHIDTIVIAGMGANNIIGFLKYYQDKLKNIKKIIIQSNTNLYFLRKNMTSIGYYIADEKLVLDKEKIYTVVMFKQGKKKYNYRELYLGPILISSSSQLFKEKCQKDLIVNEMILNNIKSGHFLYRQKLKKNIKILKDITKTN